MTKQVSYNSWMRTIIKQWEANASARFKELSRNKDHTYSEILCPILVALLSRFACGTSVLDAGCGLGFFTDYATRERFEVSGVDVSPNCVKLARSTFPQLRFCCKSITSFSMSNNNAFDACVANMLLHNVPNVADVLRSVSLLLKPRGVFIGCIPHPVHWFASRRLMSTRILIDNEQAYLTPFKIRNSAVHPAPFTYFDRSCEYYWDMMAKAGFCAIQAVSFDDVNWLPKDIVFFVASRRTRAKGHVADLFREHDQQSNDHSGPQCDRDELKIR